MWRCMIAWRSAGTRLYQPARYSASCSFKDISGLLLVVCRSEVDRSSSRSQQLLHLRPWIRIKILERRNVCLGHTIENCGLDRWPRAYSRPPFADGRVAVPHATELEEFEPQDIGHNCTVRIGKALASQVQPAFQRVHHPRQELLMMRERLGHKLGVKSVFDYVTLVLCAALE